MATFTFDGPNKRIQIDAEVGNSSFTPAELYSAWKDWVLSGNAQYAEAFAESVGGNDLGGGSSLDAYIFLRNDLGWRIRPDARDHTLTVDGNLFGASAGVTMFAATVSPAFVQIERNFSSRAVGVATGGSPASDIWSALRSANVDAGSMGQALVQLFDLMGLDPSKPLVVTPTTRVAGDIEQTIATVGTTTTVTRDP